MLVPRSAFIRTAAPVGSGGAGDREARARPDGRSAVVARTARRVLRGAEDEQVRWCWWRSRSVTRPACSRPDTATSHGCSTQTAPGRTHPGWASTARHCRNPSYGQCCRGSVSGGRCYFGRRRRHSINGSASVVATTNDRSDDVRRHAALAPDSTRTGTVVPAFRADKCLTVGRAGRPDSIAVLGDVADVDSGDYPGRPEPTEARRCSFIEGGVRSASQSTVAATQPPDAAYPVRTYRSAREGSVMPSGPLRGNMPLEMACMSRKGGLVMTQQPPVHRGGRRPTFEAIGADPGHELVPCDEFVDALRSLQERRGTGRNLHHMPVTFDELAFSRERRPAARFYPSVYMFHPWSSLDSPEGVRHCHPPPPNPPESRRRLSSTTLAPSARSGPTPALSSVSTTWAPAGLVATHRFDEDAAHETAVNLAAGHPTRVVKL